MSKPGVGANPVASAAMSKRMIDSGESKVELVVEERGEGRPYLLLHGGAGPVSVSRFANLLSERRRVRVVTPTHPGFAGSTRPSELNDMKGLARVYVALLDDLGVSDVTVIGNSMGGWVAAEMALLATPRIRQIVLVDAVGIEVPGHPVTDISKLTLDEVMRLSYHDPKPFRVDPASMTGVQRSMMAANRAALQVYSGRGTDPTLTGRLAAARVPTLVVWGESDRIVDADYGRAWAAAIPGAEFKLLAGTGHVPQIETPERLLDAIPS